MMRKDKKQAGKVKRAGGSGRPQPGVTRTGVEVRLAEFLGRRPRLGRGVYLARGAVVVGDVTLGDNSSVWHNAVLRGDINRIVVGRGTNIQDSAVLHLADAHACEVGDYVTIGHSAVVHACRVEDEVLVGMGAVILDGSVIGRQSIVAAGALVPQGTQVPPGSLVMGVPGKVVRRLTERERKRIRYWAEKYVDNARYCLSHGWPTERPSAVGRARPARS